MHAPLTWPFRGPLTATLLFVLATGAAAAQPAPEPVTIVVCAPGYPGTTDDAQPTMDRFAAALAGAAGPQAGDLRAEYHNTLEGGRDRIRAADTAVAIVPYAFYWAEGAELQLTPFLQVVRDHGPLETWALVSGKGRVAGPADLDSWEITGLPGFSPAFVRRRVLDGWGPLPESTRITFAARVVSALRRATRGENVAVLLDPSQTDALPALPFGGDLEVVVRSPALPGFVVCRVDARLADGQAARLSETLVRLHRKKDGREALEAMRMVRFEEPATDLPPPPAGLAPAP